MNPPLPVAPAPREKQPPFTLPVTERELAERYQQRQAALLKLVTDSNAKPKLDELTGDSALTQAYFLRKKAENESLDNLTTGFNPAEDRTTRNARIDALSGKEKAARTAFAELQDKKLDALGITSPELREAVAELAYGKFEEKYAVTAQAFGRAEAPKLLNDKELYGAYAQMQDVIGKVAEFKAKHGKFRLPSDPLPQEVQDEAAKLNSALTRTEESWNKMRQQKMSAAKLFGAVEQQAAEKLLREEFAKRYNAEHKGMEKSPEKKSAAPLSPAALGGLAAPQLAVRAPERSTESLAV